MTQRERLQEIIRMAEACQEDLNTKPKTVVDEIWEEMRVAVDGNGWPSDYQKLCTALTEAVTELIFAQIQHAPQHRSRAISEGDTNALRSILSILKGDKIREMRNG